MEMTIKTRSIGEITFSRPGAGHIFVDMNGCEGALGNQICSGGDLMGWAISYHGDDYEAFKKICRNWWKQHRRQEAMC